MVQADQLHGRATRDDAGAVLAAILRTDDLRSTAQSRLDDGRITGAANECWPWWRTKNRQGYGRMRLPIFGFASAHRVAYALHYNDPIGDLHVCHRCDNPQCVNPAHLFLGTAADNAADKIAKGRAKTGDQRGAMNGAAKLTADDVALIRRMIANRRNNTWIAPRFGVTHQAISKIRRGHAWVG